MGRIVFGAILVLIGLSVLTGIPFLGIVIGIIFIAFGIKVMAGKEGHKEGTAQVSHDDMLNEVAIFSPIHKAIASQHFRGGRVVLVFAGGEIDLRGAGSTGELDLEIAVVFGTVKVFVPKHWKVVMRNAVVLGNVNNRTEQGTSAVVNVKGAAVFGNIEVEN